MFRRAAVAEKLPHSTTSTRGPELFEVEAGISRDFLSFS